MIETAEEVLPKSTMPAFTQLASSSNPWSDKFKLQLVHKSSFAASYSTFSDRSDADEEDISFDNSEVDACLFDLCIDDIY